MVVMRTSQQGIDLLAEREGMRTRAYLDSVGVPTIGIGHTGPDVYLGLVWPEETCKAVFARDLAKYEDAVNESLEVEVTQCQFDALVSFTYNVGIYAEAHSTMLRYINEGDFKDVDAQFDRWHIPRDIISRRNGEREQFAGRSFQARID
jgi:lysozyme